MQGVMDRGPIGAIQNLGVIPSTGASDWAGPWSARPSWLPAGRAPQGLPGSHRREHRRRPALPQHRLPPGQDTLQGGRRMNEASGESAMARLAIAERRDMAKQSRAFDAVLPTSN